MEYLKVIVGSILAGMILSVGAMAYLLSEFKFVGALIFTVGLFVIMVYKLKLYTGKAGYIVENPPIYVAEVLLIVLGNFIGCLLMGLAFPLDQAVVAVEAKLATPYLTLFVKAIFCGLLVHVAADQYKTKGSFVALFICVPAFIMAGLEHSIANMFFLASAGVFNFDALIFTLIALLGNGIGCMLLPAYQKYIDKEKPAVKA